MKNPIIRTPYSGQEVRTWSFGLYAAQPKRKFVSKTLQNERTSEGIICYIMNLHFFCLESGVEQSSSARYNMVTDKQEVITLRFRNSTRIWLYQDDTHTQRILRRCYD